MSVPGRLFEMSASSEASQSENVHGKMQVLQGPSACLPLLLVTRRSLAYMTQLPRFGAGRMTRSFVSSQLEFVGR